jgi:hypothetical protein
MRRSNMNTLRRQDAAMLERAMKRYVSFAEPDAFRQLLGDQGWQDGATRGKFARGVLGGLLDRLRHQERYEFLK